MTISDVEVCVGELAHAVQHGRPPAQAMVWVRPDRIVCTVHDGGTGFDVRVTTFKAPGRDQGATARSDAAQLSALAARARARRLAARIRGQENALAARLAQDAAARRAAFYETRAAPHRRAE